MISRRTVMSGIAAMAATPGLAQGQRAASSAQPLSLEQLVGRCLILGFLGDNPQTEGADRIDAYLDEGRIGGALFLRHNARSRRGVEGLARRFRNVAPNAWLAIDQEGGFVQRLTHDMGYGDIPTASELVSGGLERAREVFERAADDLSEAGFTMNLAPVADLHMDGNEVIGRWDRAFGDDPDVVSAYCAAFIDAMEARGIACSIKHFPGHGRSRGDSHDGFVDLTETWTFEEAAPFARLIAQDRAHLIMGGHLINRRLDPSGDPVTVSKPVLNGLLRDVMNYQGAVITDDLDMGAIRDHYSREQAVVRSLAAGNDLLLISNSANPDPDLPLRAVDWVGEAIERGELSFDRLVEANARIDGLMAHVGRA